MFNAHLNPADDAAEAFALSHLLQWIENARTYCAKVTELAHSDEEIRKAINDHLGYTYPREWDHLHEGNGLDYLMQYQRSLLASIASGTYVPADEEVQHG